MQQTVLRTPAEVIGVLGGTATVAERLGKKRTAVGNWLHPKRNKIPPEFFFVINAELALVGKIAAPEVFKMVAANGGPSNGARRQRRKSKKIKR